MVSLINCQSVSKSYGTHEIFANLKLSIEEKARIALIGPNGSGKSSLLKVLARLEDYEGEISYRQNLKISYLAQERSFQEEKNLIENLHHDAKALSTNIEDYHIHSLLNLAGFENPEAKVQTLSGGWRKRLAIISCLLIEPELFILDEPTNHLDYQGLFWLEDLLTRSQYAWIMVSHDRYFIENCAQSVFEINRRFENGIFQSSGNYSQFLEKREEYFLAQEKLQEKLSNKSREEKAWLARGPQARSTKQNARIQSAHKLFGDLEKLKSRNKEVKSKIQFSSSERKTKKLLECKKISKSFGNTTIVDQLDLILSPKIKLGILGPNGSGKSTLLKMILGKVSLDSGEIIQAQNLKLVYFDQNRDQLNPNETLKEALCEGQEQVIYQDRPVHHITWAKRFSFGKEKLLLPVKELSGGEKARLLIAQLMLQTADCLLLDEPTNDLDIPTLEILEESLTEFKGCLLLVSHDRYLLEKTCNVFLALDGSGQVDILADYAQWELLQKKKDKPEKKIKAPAKSTPKQKKKLSYKEQLEFSQMEEKILNQEALVASLTENCSDPKIQSDNQKLTSLLLELKEAQDHLDQMYARWSELEEKQELN